MITILLLLLYTFCTNLYHSRRSFTFKKKEITEAFDSIESLTTVMLLYKALKGSHVVKFEKTPNILRLDYTAFFGSPSKSSVCQE